MKKARRLLPAGSAASGPDLYRTRLSIPRIKASRYTSILLWTFFRRYFWPLSILILGILLFELLHLPSGKLEVHFLDIGQGDATFIVTPDSHQILIDGGPDLSVLEYLGSHMSFFDQSLDLLVLTHPHKDHLTALPEVLTRFNIAAVMLTGVEHDIGRYEWLLHEVRQEGAEILFPDPTKDLFYEDGVALDIVWPPPSMVGTSVKNLNNSSIVLRILYSTNAGTVSLLLPGDIEKDVENAILQSGVEISADVLKVPHHGSTSSSTEAFLDAVDPIIAIISVGKGNRFGHPHREVIERLEERGIEVRRTDEEGNIVLKY